MAKKYMLTYRLNPSITKRLSLWLENPLKKESDIDDLENYLTEYHKSLKDDVDPNIGCKLIAFSTYDTGDENPFENTDDPDIMFLHEMGGIPTKEKPKLKLVKFPKKESSTHGPDSGSTHG